MKQRYNITETYFGLYDEKIVIACTDDLMHAVRIVEQLNEASKHSCYEYDFIKIHNAIDVIKDYYPGRGLFNEGTCLNCKNYKEYKERKEEWDKNHE